MEQQRALNALEPYLALSKSANSPRAAADLITQATSSPNTYVFAELLETPNIQKLRQSRDYASHLKLLEIFAWGTLSDYQGGTRSLYTLLHNQPLTQHSATPNLPSLSAAQLQKLKILSLLPLLTSPTTLSYASLLAALDIPTIPILEALVTTAIYANLVTAHLDPLHQCVAVTSVAPLRDLAPGSVPQLSATLEAWQVRCDEVLREIEDKIETVRREAKVRSATEKGREALFEAELMKLDEKDGKGGKRAASSVLEGGFGADDGGDAMEVDEGRGQASRGTKRLGRVLGALRG